MITRKKCPEIYEYLDYVKKNPKKINERRKKLIKNIVKPLLRRNDIVFDSEEYYRCLNYCEKKYFKLFPYQKFIYAFVFMYWDEAKTILVFTKFLIMMGRGNGKTSMLMPLCDYLTTPLHGIRGYNIDIIANSEDQAKKDFMIIYNCLEKNADKYKGKFKWTLSVITNKQTQSEIKYNTSNAKTKDGKEGGAILFDEVHEYENMKQINVFENQQGKAERERVFYITTQGYVRDGALDEVLEVCDDILDSGNLELEYFPFLCCLDSEEEADKEELWEKANPSIEYRDVLKRKIKKSYLEAKKSPSKWVDFLVKRMNLIKEQAENYAIARKYIVEANRDIPYEKLKGQKCIGCLDYASVNDFVGCGLLFNIDGEIIYINHNFICKESEHLPIIRERTDIDVWVNEIGLATYVNAEQIDPKQVAKWFVEKEKELGCEIIRMVMDKYRYNLVKQAFEEIGFKSPTSKAERKQMEESGEKLIDLTIRKNIMYNEPIIESAFINKKVTFGNNPMLRWMINNTKKIPCAGDNFIYEKIEWKYRKNDGFMAFVHGFTRLDILEEKQESIGIVYDIPTLVF